MGMDQLYEELDDFIRQLRQFNAQMAQDWDALQTVYDAADEIWTEGGDATRRQFESDWAEMSAQLDRYRRQHSESYEHFLDGRKRALDRYFGK